MIYTIYKYVTYKTDPKKREEREKSLSTNSSSTVQFKQADPADSPPPAIASLGPARPAEGPRRQPSAAGAGLGPGSAAQLAVGRALPAGKRPGAAVAAGPRFRREAPSALTGPRAGL